MELRYNNVASQFDDRTKVRASSAFGNFDVPKKETKTSVPSGLVSTLVGSLGSSLSDSLSSSLGSSLSDSLSSSLGTSLGNSLGSSLGSELGAPLATSPPSLNSTSIISSISTEEAMPDLVDVPRKMMKNFLKHMDTHSDSSLFASVSKGDAYIYYDLDGIDVARVLVPAGLSIIMTTDIHSGLIIKNPHGLSHRSESEQESHRGLLRLVLEPKTGGMDMALSNE
jgi:hypothetical protein